MSLVIKNLNFKSKIFRIDELEEFGNNDDLFLLKHNFKSTFMFLNIKFELDYSNFIRQHKTPLKWVCMFRNVHTNHFRGVFL